MVRFVLQDRVGAMSEQTLESELETVPKGDLNRVVSFGMQEVSRISNMESRLIEHKAFLTAGSTAFAYFVNMKPSDEAAPLGENGLMVTKATQKLREV